MWTQGSVGGAGQAARVLVEALAKLVELFFAHAQARRVRVPPKPSSRSAQAVRASSMWKSSVLRAEPWPVPSSSSETTMAGRFVRSQTFERRGR